MPDRKSSRDALSPAHVAVLAIAALLVVAIVFGIASGVVNLSMLRQPTPSPSDPVTLP